MGKLIKNSYKLLILNPFFLCICGVFFIFINYIGIGNLLHETHQYEPFLYLLRTIQISTPFFIFFLFFSFEFFAKAKDSYLYEMVSSINSGKLKMYLYQSLVPLTLAAFFTLLTLIHVVIYYFFYGINNVAYLIHTLLNLLLNILLPSILAVMIALLCSISLGRIISYCILLLTAFLITPFSNTILYRLSHTIGADLTLSKYYLNILSQNSNSMPDTIYGLPLEQFRWFLIFFYLFALTLLCLWKLKAYRKKTIRWGMATFMIGVMFCGFHIIYPGSLQRMDLEISTLSLSDEAYYLKNTKQKENLAQYSIKSYNMEFDINKELLAKVSIKVESSENVKQYFFTLYHGLQIDKITDENGDTLPFKRDGDYLEVTNSSNNTIGTISLEYHGYYPGFYSNNQGIWLAGNLYYYPVEGYQKVWDEYTRGFIFHQELSTKEFSIKVNSPLTVICNLNGEKNVFHGSERAATLVGGIFLQKYEMNGLSAYKSNLDNFDLRQYETFPDVLKKYESLVGTQIGISSNLKVFFASIPVANSDKNEVVAFGDHILMLKPWPVDAMAVQLLISKLPGDYNKSTLRYGLLAYLTDKRGAIDSANKKFGNSDTFNLPQGFIKQEMDQGEIDAFETQFWMNQKAKSMDEGVFYQKVYAYLANENDHTPELEFIKNLK